MPRSSRNRGFTLVEVLAAFVILAMTLGAVYASFTGGLSSESRAERAARAALVARSALSEFGVSRLIAPDVYEEEYESGDFARITVERIAPLPENPVGERGAAFLVTVEAGSDGEVAAVLRTVRLGYAQLE